MSPSNNLIWRTELICFPCISLNISLRARSLGKRYFNSVASCSLVDSGFDKEIGFVGSSLKHVH